MHLHRLLVAALPLTFACSSATSPDSSEDAVGAKEPSVHLTILESKVVFDSKPVAFSVSVPGTAGTLELTCRDDFFAIESPKSLYDGWTVAQADAFGSFKDGARYRDYTFSRCRDAKTEVIAWYGQDRDIQLTPTEQMLNERYDPKTLPLLLRIRTIESGTPAYFSCNSETKSFVSETENSKKFDIAMKCKSTSAPSAKATGPIDFLDQPGPYAAELSYDSRRLPPLTSESKSFTKVKNALLGKVAAGKYAGAMSTLAKTCTLDISATDGTLVIDHTIDSSGNTRHLELKPEMLLGFAEGDLYEDLNRYGGEPVGTFAAAEFADPRGDRSLVVRFESNDSLDQQVVRVNGSEAYCRRLVATK